MASRTIVIRTDDIDGSEGAETVSFGLDGARYEIDLSSENADQLRSALAPYIEQSRRASTGKVRGSRGQRGRAQSSPDRETTGIIREWAREQGHTVSDRGRLPGWIVSAYEEAH